jgi:hypothetical protein
MPSSNDQLNSLQQNKRFEPIIELNLQNNTPCRATNWTKREFEHKHVTINRTDLLHNSDIIGKLSVKKGNKKLWALNGKDNNRLRAVLHAQQKLSTLCETKDHNSQP